jgi:hypothetical protein|tara:strand:- start:927 stop:1166 length:240 start_codon:yes stop_codon:yes gene_type:complete
MGLSKKQNQRLGAILSVMFKEEAPSAAIGQIITDGFAEKKGESIGVTEKGLDEKNRLCTLAGLNIKYTSEPKKKPLKES